MISIEDMLAYLNIELDEQSQKVLNHLKTDKRVDENKLAEQLSVKVNSIRKALYKLSGPGYAVYSKKKSKNKKWWYEYNWTLDRSKLVFDYLAKKKSELKGNEEKLAREQGYTFVCSGCGSKLTYEDGLEHGFSCSKCGSPLEEIASSEVVRSFTREVDAMRIEISKLEGEFKKPEKISDKAEKLAKRKQRKALLRPVAKATKEKS